jgi:hypothetical protein
MFSFEKEQGGDAKPEEKPRKRKRNPRPAECEQGLDARHCWEHGKDVPAKGTPCKCGKVRYGEE